MKKSYIILLSTIFILIFIFLLKLIPAKQVKPGTAVSFYEVPLECEAAPEIGCGSSA